MEIREAQRQLWENKTAKGFNLSDIPLEFCLLTTEVAEAFTAWRRSLADFGEELADIALYVMSLAEMNGLDLDTEIQRKLVKNAARVYERDANGVPYRVSGT